MRILQPADWSKPRGFSHGVALDGPGRWIVLAGQTGGDGKGDYQPDMAGQGGAGPHKIVKMLSEARAGPRHILPSPPVFDQPPRKPGPPGPDMRRPAATR